jgi:nucleoside 2-deoxyribosyltransferase
MKIYFAGSIRGGRTRAVVYQSMIKFLSSFGEVLTVHVGNTSLSEEGEDGPDDGYIYERDMAWLLACDIVVAEVSIPSLGVGYELGCAVALKKPVLCLYGKEIALPLSAMIAGNPYIQISRYASLCEAEQILGAFVRNTH